MFRNRTDAGKQLAKKLDHYKHTDALVLAIPRGGAPVAVEVAKHIQSEFSYIMVRKLPFPNNPESGFGAIAEDGSTMTLKSGLMNLSPHVIKLIIESQKEEIKRRIKILRGGRSLPKLSDRIVILIDDGIATGSTMRVAIKMCQKQHPTELIVGSPVCSPELARALNQNDAVDDVIILEQPRFFRAVAQVYHHWYAVPDYEVIEIMKNWHRKLKEPHNYSGQNLKSEDRPEKN